MKSISKAKSPLWYEEGIRFECQGSGQCCTSHGEYGFVFVSLEDRRQLAKALKISTLHFTKKYCDKNSDGHWHLKEIKGQPDCLFLKQKSCTVYQARPCQCRTWPFWPEVMSPKKWSKEVAAFCPGVGKGPLRSLKEIQGQLQIQLKSNQSIVNKC